MKLVSTRITQLSAALLLVTLALGLVLPKVAGIGFLGLSAIALIWLTTQRAWLDGGLMSLERLFILFMVALVCIWLLAWWFHGLSEVGWSALGRMLRLLLIVPLFLFLRRLAYWPMTWWYGLMAGGLIAGSYALWFFITGQTATFEQRVEGATNPIYFGGITLAMAVMMLPKLTDPDLKTPARLAFGLAIAMAFCASLLSGSRGAWLALFPMMGLYVFTLGRRQPLRWRFGLPAVVGVMAVAVLMTPQVPTSERFLEGFEEIARLAQGEMTDGALGRRWHMWLIAAEALKDHWWLGIGPGAFAQALSEAIQAGEASALMSPYRHPHNQYLSVLTDAGLVALLVFVLLLATAARRFYRLWFSGLHTTRDMAWAGLSVLVLLSVMALSESIFERNAGIVWFGLLVAGSLGLVQVQKREELAKTALRRRRQRLSVIIITKNEADRIEACLKPLIGWADELIIFDSGSEDGTPERAQALGASVHQTDWPGYGRQKQRALATATGDWILSIDADEVVSASLKAEIDGVLQASESMASSDIEFVAYTLPWLTHVSGRTLKHGRWSRTPLRLIQKGAGDFSDVPVHESIHLYKHQPVGHLDSPLHHYPYRDWDHAKRKLDHYAALQASQEGQGQRSASSALISALRASYTFIDNYVLRGACLDGWTGFQLSQLMATYTWKKYRLR